MLFSNHSNTKDFIISAVSRSSMSSTELQTLISEKQNITKQAFYKALRELIQNEILLKNKQHIILNNAWINQLQDFVTSVDTTQVLDQQGFLELEEGESIVHHFDSLSSLNKLWMHYFFIAAKKYPQEDIIFYNRHNFWTLFRFEVENSMFKWIKDNNRVNYLIIGGASPLDRSTTGHILEFGTTMHYESKSSFEKNHYSLTVIGDYIFDTTLDLNTSTAIDNLYKKHLVWNKTIAKELEEIFTHLKRSKVVIKRDKYKAEQIRKKLMKYFIFYK